MPFLQLILTTGATHPENLESACFAAGALSVTLADAADHPILEPGPGATPLWPEVQLTALFDDKRTPAEIGVSIAQALGGALPPHRFERLADRVWEREWLAHFKPLRFGRRLWICPHGQPPPDPQAVVVWLDPGLAFGTGTHPTTAMCLEWLDAHQPLPPRVVDYGCGSGILALAALKLGASSVVAIDLDPQALTATLENARRNQLAEHIRVCDAAGPVAPTDLLLANILAGPLIELAARFGELVKPGGRVLLSGILASQVESVALAYQAWFDMRPFAAREDWACLDGVRR